MRRARKAGALVKRSQRSLRQGSKFSKRPAARRLYKSCYLEPPILGFRARNAKVGQDEDIFHLCDFCQVLMRQERDLPNKLVRRHDAYRRVFVAASGNATDFGFHAAFLCIVWRHNNHTNVTYQFDI
jgi:hypothetical protein